MTPIAEIIAALDKVEREATTGPWRPHIFVAIARNSLRAVLDHVAELEEDNARLREKCDISIGQTERLLKEKAAWLEYRAVLVALDVPAYIRTTQGHSESCSAPEFQCDCGHDALVEALAACRAREGKDGSLCGVT